MPMTHRVGTPTFVITKGEGERVLGKQRVFISHSAEGDECATQILDRLGDLLAEKNYEVLVDKHALEPEEEYEPQIMEWLEGCDFAIFLLSAKALAREWVRDEANYLTMGSPRSRKVALCPVLLDGVEPDAVR